MSEAILDCAREKEREKIVLGKPTRTGWRRWVLGSVVDDQSCAKRMTSTSICSLATRRSLHRRCRTLAAAAQPRLPRAGFRESETAKSASRVISGGVASLPLITALSAFMFGFLELVNLVMLYLLGVMYVATRFGRGPSVLASTAFGRGVRFLFRAAALFVSRFPTCSISLLRGHACWSGWSSARSQSTCARRPEFPSIANAAPACFTPSRREFGSTQSEDEIAARLRSSISARSSRDRAWCCCPIPRAGSAIRKSQSIQYSFHGSDLGVAQWVFDHGKIAGKGTDTLPGTEGVYFPMRGVFRRDRRSRVAAGQLAPGLPA